MIPDHVPHDRTTVSNGWLTSQRADARSATLEKQLGLNTCIFRYGTWLDSILLVPQALPDL